MMTEHQAISSHRPRSSLPPTFSPSVHIIVDQKGQIVTPQEVGCPPPVQGRPTWSSIKTWPVRQSAHKSSSPPMQALLQGYSSHGCREGSLLHPSPLPSSTSSLCGTSGHPGWTCNKHIEHNTRETKLMVGQKYLQTSAGTSTFHHLIQPRYKTAWRPLATPAWLFGAWPVHLDSGEVATAAVRQQLASNVEAPVAKLPPARYSNQDRSTI